MNDTIDSAQSEVENLISFQTQQIQRNISMVQSNLNVLSATTNAKFEETQLALDSIYNLTNVVNCLGAESSEVMAQPPGFTAPVSVSCEDGLATGFVNIHAAYTLSPLYSAANPFPTHCVVVDTLLSISNIDLSSRRVDALIQPNGFTDPINVTCDAGYLSNFNDVTQAWRSFQSIPQSTIVTVTCPQIYELVQVLNVTGSVATTIGVAVSRTIGTTAVNFIQECSGSGYAIEVLDASPVLAQIATLTDTTFTSCRHIYDVILNEFSEPPASGQYSITPASERIAVYCDNGTQHATSKVTDTFCPILSPALYSDSTMQNGKHNLPVRNPSEET